MMLSYWKKKVKIIRRGITTAAYVQMSDPEHDFIVLIPEY